MTERDPLTPDQLGHLHAVIRAQSDALETAWGVIANAGGGDWTKESPNWQFAAGRFRQMYHSGLGEMRMALELLGDKPPAPSPSAAPAWVCPTCRDPRCG